MGRQGRKRGAGKNKCLMFHVDTAALFADGGSLSQGSCKAPFPASVFHIWAKNRGGQGGHLALSIYTSPSLSASVSPLLSTSYPGRSMPLTAYQAVRSPEYKREIQTLSVLPHSILLPTRNSVKGAAQLQAGVHLLILLPRFYTNSSFPSFCTGNRLLPRPEQRDGTAVCPAPGKEPSSPLL